MHTHPKFPIPQSQNRISKSNNRSLSRARLLTSTALGLLLLLLRLNLRSLEGSASAQNILQRLVVSLIWFPQLQLNLPTQRSHFVHSRCVRRRLPKPLPLVEKPIDPTLAHRSELLQSFATEPNPEKQPARIPRPIFTCDLTFPARARDPWTLPILTVLSAAVVASAVGATHLLDVEKTRSQPAKLQCSEGRLGVSVSWRRFLRRKRDQIGGTHIFTTHFSCDSHVAQMPHGDPAVSLVSDKPGRMAQPRNLE